MEGKLQQRDGTLSVRAEKLTAPVIAGFMIDLFGVQDAVHGQVGPHGHDVPQRLSAWRSPVTRVDTSFGTVE